MKDKKLVTLIILGILAVFSLVYGTVAPTKTARKLSAERAALRQKQRGKLTEEFIPVARDRKRTDFNSWSRDPFAPGDISALGISELALNGIIWDRVEPNAIINDEIVKIGDKVLNYKIVDIKYDKVIINDGVNNFELRLKQEE